jgi:hypothetical protein
LRLLEADPALQPGRLEVGEGFDVDAVNLAERYRFDIDNGEVMA